MITWSKLAEEDLENIQVYLKKTGHPDSVRYVLYLIGLIEGMLTQFPNLGRVGTLPNTRERVIKGLPYRVVYSVAASGELYIMAVLHTAQQSPGGL